MINKQRVQRIRTVIYTILILIVFIPILLIMALSIKTIGMLNDITALLRQNQPSISQSQLPSEQSGQDGATIEPEPQSLILSSPEDAEQPPPFKEESRDASRQDDVSSVAGEYVQNMYSPTTFPGLYFETLPVPQSSAEKTLYLTFDNTPSLQPQPILDVLKKHGVQATFFVWWNDSLDQLNNTFYKSLLDSGHQIGIHSGTNTDSFSEIYSSSDRFLIAYNEIFDQIYVQTGIKTRLYRLPGGSVTPENPQRQAVISEIKAELDARGFLQYDWDASAQDAVIPSLSKEQILHNIKNSIGRSGQVVILLHDGTGSTSTAQALDSFIEEYKAAGYSFRTLDYDTKPVSFLDNR